MGRDVHGEMIFFNEVEVVLITVYLFGGSSFRLSVHLIIFIELYMN